MAPKPVNNMSVINGYSLPELCRLHTHNCVKLLAEIVCGETDEGEPIECRYQDRIRAAETLLNRGYGRPLDFVTMRDLETNNSRRTIDMTNDELAELIANVA